MPPEATTTILKSPQHAVYGQQLALGVNHDLEVCQPYIPPIIAVSTRPLEVPIPRRRDASDALEPTHTQTARAAPTALLLPAHATHTAATGHVSEFIISKIYKATDSAFVLVSQNINNTTCRQFSFLVLKNE
jgi:hypothetical protein